MNLPALAPASSSTGLSTWLTPQTFEAAEKIAGLMSRCGTMPQHLVGKPADCFRIVVQAAKWQMDPFAVGECTSLVHGRMCYEGKLVHAVLISMGAIKGNLDFEYSGPAGTDQRTVVVSGTLPNGQVRTVTGTVADWKTKHNGSPWTPGSYDRQLAYRGTREWARMWAPQAVLGVYTPDESEETKTVEAEVVTTTTVAEPKPAKSKKAKDPEQATPAAVETTPAQSTSGTEAGATVAQASAATVAPAAGTRPSHSELATAARKLLMAGPAGQVRLRNLIAKWKIESVEDMAGEGDDACIRFHAELVAELKAVGGQ